MIVHTEAIVLKTMDFRETSKIATFFTKDYGKVKGIMKGVRSDPRKFGSNVDKFSVNDVVYYQYSRSDLHLISKCDLKQFYFPVRQDYKKSMAATYALELVDAVLPTEEKNTKVYQLLLDYLEELQDVKDVDRLVYILQIKILNLSGFKPFLDACVSCGKKVHGRVRFSLKEGGLICPDCPTRETTFSFISKGAISSLLHIESESLKSALRLGLTLSVRRELKFVLNNFLVYHLEKRLKSERFL